MKHDMFNAGLIFILLWVIRYGIIQGIELVAYFREIRNKKRV